MSFLNPWAIGVAAAAAALPFVIHWLTRPRPVRMPLSTIRFVREAIRQRRARHRLRDAIVLALRVLAVVLLGWAIARPLIGQRPAVSDLEAGSAVRVVVLDVSQSMAAGEHGIEAFERARAIAAEHLEYRRGLWANLILAGATSTPVFQQPSANLAALREQLASSHYQPQRLQVLPALSLAAEMLAKLPAEQARRELVVVSDFQRSNWAAADFSLLPEDTHIQLESVAPADAPSNLAIVGVGCRGRPTEGREVGLEVEVGNFSPAARRVGVEVVVGDATYHMEELCPARTRTTLAKQIPLRGTGWQSGTARLLAIDDALAADDHRPFVLHVRRAPTYVLVSDDPLSRRPSGSYYLERALVPYARPQDDGRARVVRLPPAQLDLEALSAADLIVLDHPGRLSAENIALLASLLRRGRPILYVTSELVDATNLKRLVDSPAAGLQPPVELFPPPRGNLRRNLFVAEVKQNAAPFRIFGDGLSATLAPLRFSGGLASRRAEGALDDEILASYSDRSTCLYVTSSGAGSLAVLNADLATSSLPTSQAFVPLVGELVEHLLGENRLEQSAHSGEIVVERLPPSVVSAANLAVEGPTPDAKDVGELTVEGNGVVWNWRAAGPPGVYRVKHDEETFFSLAVTTPADESDLRRLDADVLTGRLAGQRQVHFRAALGGPQQRDDAWTWFAVACVVCMLGEVAVLRAFNT